jgi:hypothetical protein
VRAIATLIIIVLVSLPSLFGGWPGLEPGWFDERQWGVPLSVIFMSGLMLLFMILAGLCSLAAKGGRMPGAEGE